MPEHTESRTKRLLRRELKCLGFAVKSMEWEPLGMHVEKQGQLGGWLVITECGEYLTGRSIAAVIDLARMKQPDRRRLRS